MVEGIDFFVPEIDFEVVESDNLKEWVEMIAKKHGYALRQLHYIFVSDKEILKLNQDYLEHDFYTDILTFPFHPDGSKDLIGDIYISVDRVKDNANELGESFIDELHRVMIHGLLHMTGFDDTTPERKKEMRKAENFALALRMF